MTTSPRDLAEIIADAVENCSHAEGKRGGLIDLDDDVDWDSVAVEVTDALDPEAVALMDNYASLAREVDGLRQLRDDIIKLVDARNLYDRAVLNERAREWRQLVKTSRDVAQLVELHRLAR